MLERLRLLDQIYFILENNYILEFHDLDSSQMLRCLWLWTRLITSNEQQRSVHDSSAVQHGSHENVVAGAVDEGDVANELHPPTASWPLTWRVILLV